MITTIVEFKLPEPMSVSQAKKVFLSTAPKYRDMAGLIRKYYWVAPDGKTAGGIYLWQSREAADAVYTDEWKAFVTDKYGSPPSLTFLHSPVVVDNAIGEIVST
jgi:hypothetical protein